MRDSLLLHDLLNFTAERQPRGVALVARDASLEYGVLERDVHHFANGLIRLGLQRQDRIAVYLEKRIETVIALFGGSRSGGIVVPINPILKAPQVAYILRDCNVRVLVTSHTRLESIRQELTSCPDLDHVVLVDHTDVLGERFSISPWSNVVDPVAAVPHRVIDSDVAAILYTSGSTGRPKGVVLSHRNMVAGAKSVAGYLENNEHDSLLAVLPLSFDAGFSQLTTAFHKGARVVLLNHLMARDVVAALANERITGITAVPPLYMQVAQLEWPREIDENLRYFANTGGRMPLETLNRLRSKVPHAKPFLMYGLTEAFRSTYLPPEEVDRRPDSIGKAIPNAEILVLRPDGTPCDRGEPGELVHRGALVGLGYWNDPAKTAERYKPIRGLSGLTLPEYAVFSGDTVRMDEEGFLYFIGRTDEMIKTSGYRVSPTEVEEALYATGCVGEAAAFGVGHAVLGQAIVAVVTPATDASVDEQKLLTACRDALPTFMVPSKIHIVREPLPRNPNGKIDRNLLAAEYGSTQQSQTSGVAVG